MTCIGYHEVDQKSGHSSEVSADTSSKKLSDKVGIPEKQRSYHQHTV